eukprot:1160825-Pelagomonas_calceolata.AAC.11
MERGPLLYHPDVHGTWLHGMGCMAAWDMAAYDKQEDAPSDLFEGEVQTIADALQTLHQEGLSNMPACLCDWMFGAVGSSFKKSRLPRLGQ